MLREFHKNHIRILNTYRENDCEVKLTKEKLRKKKIWREHLYITKSHISEKLTVTKINGKTNEINKIIIFI